MATKKKAAAVKGAVKGSDLQKTLASMEQAVKDLNLDIKLLKKAVGHPFKGGGGGEGHPFTK